jgi:thiamine monophosphate synthase
VASAQGKDLAVAELEPDYIIVGPVLGSSNLKIQPIGLDRLEELVADSPIPLVASGGITIANLRDVLDTGALNYLISRAVTMSHDPGKEIRKYKKIEEEYLNW